MEGLLVDLRAAEDEDLVVTLRQVEGALDAAGDEHPVRRAPARVARDDDVRTAGQCLRQRLERLAAHDDAVSHRERLEALQVGGDAPGHLIVTADHAVRGDGGQDADDHTAMGALIPG